MNFDKSAAAGCSRTVKLDFLASGVVVGLLFQ
jgi:hypothetical protein